MNDAATARRGLDRRRLVPEILDGLPPDDSRARRSRGDLARINIVMRQAAIAASLVTRHLPIPQGAPVRICELGCGDGRSMLRVARRLARRYRSSELTLIDMAPTVSDRTLAGFAALGWTVRVVTADAFDWLAGAREGYDLALANLFLHHFEDDDLTRLLAALAPRTDLLVATEPLRTMPSLLASRLVGLIGANDVTRHDAPASVRAGFRGGELGALWAPACGTVMMEGTRVPFIHAFVGRTGGNRRTGGVA